MEKINLEEILWKAFHNNNIPKPEHLISKKITCKAVKEVMKKKACNIVIDLYVYADRNSILKVKELIKQ